MKQYDVVVIGAGPGGYVAAIRATQCGLNVAVIEANHLGGICLNWGCIPTKSLLRSAEVLLQIRHSDSYGISVGEVRPDITAMVNRAKSVSAKLASGIGYLLKKNHVTTIEGKATFVDSQTLAIGGKQIQGRHIIIATGASARELPQLPFEDKRVWSYRQALRPNKIPKRLLVVGSGAIGIEFANFYHILGSDVTVIEMMTQILPNEDKEIADLAMAQMAKRGIKFMLSSKVEQLDGDQALVSCEGEAQRLSFDKMISAVGVAPNVNDLGLENVGIALSNNGFIATNAQCQTNIAGVYAIGDVAGAPCLAHKASHEGMIAAEHIAGLSPHELDRKNIPGCTYGFPQVASIGHTEQALKDQERGYKVGRFNLSANGKAIAMGEDHGMVKVLFCENTGELLGAHMVGSEVTEMIQGFAIGKTLETTEEQLMETIFPHPTISEAMHEAVLDAYQQAIHG